MTFLNADDPTTPLDPSIFEDFRSDTGSDHEFRILEQLNRDNMGVYNLQFEMTFDFYP